MDVKKTTTSSGLDTSLKVQTTEDQDVDRATGEAETTWQSTNWTTYNAYYKEHLSIKSVINRVGMWSIGTGYTAEKKVKKILDKINGWGKDTFDEILDNQIRIKHVNGDSYAEIVRDNGKLVNLKPLNPGTIKHHVNAQGILTKYSQINTNG